MKIINNIIPNCDGSARIIQYDSIITCGVKAPIELTSMKEIYDRGYIEVNIKPSIGFYNIKIKQVECIIIQILNRFINIEKYKRQGIMINIQIDHGFNLSNIFNTCIIALINAKNKQNDFKKIKKMKIKK